MKFSHHALLMAIAPPMVVLKCVAAASSPANTIAVSADQNSQASVPGAIIAGGSVSSASMTSVSGAVGATLQHPTSLKLTTEEQKRFLEDQSITQVTSATKWRILTQEAPGAGWIIRLLQFFPDMNCEGDYIYPWSGTAIKSGKNVLPENALNDNGNDWIGYENEDGDIFIGIDFEGEKKDVRCVKLDQPETDYVTTTAVVQAYHEDELEWVNVWIADDLQVGDNTIRIDWSTLATPEPTPSPTAAIQKFASGADDDFQITANKGSIEFEDSGDFDGGGRIIYNLEISTPPDGNTEEEDFFTPTLGVFTKDCLTPIKDSNGNADLDVIKVALGQKLEAVPEGGEENMDYRPVTVNVDVKRLSGSTVYSEQGDGETGVLEFCVRADIGRVTVTGGSGESSLSFVKMVFTITLKMEQDFSNAGFEVTIEEKETQEDKQEENVDYGLQGCLCDAGTRLCITDENSDAFKVKSNSAFAICAYTESENVVIKGIRSLSITKGNIGYDVVNSSGDATNELFTSLSDMGSKREVVVTRMLSIFYGDAGGTSQVKVAGKALLEFAKGRMRQLVSLNDVDVRSLQEAEEAGESAFDFDVQLDSAEIDEAGTAAKMSGYAMNVVVMALGMSMVVMPW